MTMLTIPTSYGIRKLNSSVHYWCLGIVLMNSPTISRWTKIFTMRPPTASKRVDQAFGQGNAGGWDLNPLMVDNPFEVYNIQYISTRTMKMRSNPPYKRVRLDTEITELQLPPPLLVRLMSSRWENSAWGLYFPAIVMPWHRCLLQIQCGKSKPHGAVSANCRN